MDEGQLSDLFAAAVRDAPPASFDERDVAVAAKRATAHRRSVLLGSSGLAVVVLAAGLLVGMGVFGPTLGDTTTSGVASGSAPDLAHTFGRNAAPGRIGEPGSAAPVFPGISPKLGGATAGRVGPEADSTPNGCGPADRELAVALANELPSVGADPVRPTDAVQVPLSCESGTRAAGYVVHQGAATGQVIALLSPANRPLTAPATTAGTAAATAQVSGGRLLTVLSEPLPGSAGAPVAGRLHDLAVVLAGQF